MNHPIPEEPNRATSSGILTGQVAAPTAAQVETALLEEELEATFKERRPVLWFLTLIAPFALTILAIGMLWFISGFKHARRIVLAALITLFVTGPLSILTDGSERKWTIFGNEFALKLPTNWEMFLTVFFMDVMFAIFLVFHFRLIYRIPIIGKKVQELEVDGRVILAANPWMKRLTFLGVVSFVALPLSFTGSFGGAIFGRLLGLKRITTFYGVVLGGFIGALGMYLISLAAGKMFDHDHPLLQLGGIALVVGILVYLNSRYKKMKQMHLSEKLEEQQSSIITKSALIAAEKAERASASKRSSDKIPKS